ncbi:MAG TPA: ribosome-associated translation inhibitor RaiA [Intrasporangium sp.]|uniref:ribosome hibernation-promoting factor, HPF/YfiA family n=1 Tax=Intrasporangium sp. TaxID=1925024 RepID=UPI002D783799|nr:ribosome-associated translation inhibitor RaiA [Intrasporangium sp.]HET7400008.1 ribosome-associated translation inhibitor RaiA [Intrasporangium sp.]
MEIVVTGRHVQIPDRFREQLEERLAKVPALAPKVNRIDVVVTHERVTRGSDRVEITCHAKGPVIRAESCMDDKFAALDAAVDKLMERLRRVHDRKRVSRGRRLPESVSQASARFTPPGSGESAPDEQSTGATDDLDRFGAMGNSPIEVREKVHTAAPMTLEDAINQMELVGHDFFLFHDVEADRPSVVYRRRGWSYGVLHLETAEEEADATAATG